MHFKSITGFFPEILGKHTKNNKLNKKSRHSSFQYINYHVFTIKIIKSKFINV